jgi:hypothetical protein
MTYQQVHGMHKDVLRFRGVITAATATMVLMAIGGVYLMYNDPYSQGVGLFLFYCCVFVCAITIPYLQPGL